MEKTFQEIELEFEKIRNKLDELKKREHTLRVEIQSILNEM